MIQDILPDGVVAVDAHSDRLDIALFPEELAALGPAVEKRRREFITARACARDALAQLGLGACPIATGERGQPIWPAGIVGSITHCNGYRACAVARETEFAGVGIDSGPNEPLQERILTEVTSADERLRLAELASGEPALYWDRLLFSAKETVYKTWFPVTKRRMKFDDATVSFDPSRHVFHARLRIPTPIMEGSWLIQDGLILTALAVPRRQLSTVATPPA